MTPEEVVWRWLKLSEEERQRAARKMMEDGRIELGDRLKLIPAGEDFVSRRTDGSR